MWLSKLFQRSKTDDPQGFLEKEDKAFPEELSVADRRETLLGYLATFTDEIPVTRQFLADRFKVTENAIKVDVRTLVAAGRLIFVRQDGNNGSIYKVPNQIKSRTKGAN